MSSSREILTGYFLAGIAAAGAKRTLPALLPKQAPVGRTIILGCGKAAAEMAEVAVEHLSSHVSGCVVTRHGHGVGRTLPGIEVIEARHPVPDNQSLEAGERLLKLAASAGASDRVVFLISGGGSSLLCAPAPGLTLADKQAMTDHLVRSGAPIEDINLVRRHVSRVKGGRLAAAAGARGADLITYLISDVANDDPALIASGPSIGAPFIPEEAIAILDAYGWPLSPHIAAAIRRNHPRAVPEHPAHILATNSNALDAVIASARADGWNVVDLGARLTGDAATMGKAHAVRAQEMATQPGRHLLVSGGELTVTGSRKDGCGGPNLEYLTGLLSALDPGASIEAVAGDTDGIDGSEDNAGGYITAAWASQADCAAALANNRTYDLFTSLGGLIITGPTRTNVNDIRMIAVEGSSQ
jgi:hydroxypyruvate reductase